ncbi:MAG: hypothetical protein ACXW1D_00555 [Halobacteriota archaeon]
MKDKSTHQKLFEAIRHYVGSKHQVPSHLTEWELRCILNLLTKEDIKL